MSAGATRRCGPSRTCRGAPEWGTVNGGEVPRGPRGDRPHEHQRGERGGHHGEGRQGGGQRPRPAGCSARPAGGGEHRGQGGRHPTAGGGQGEPHDRSGHPSSGWQGELPGSASRGGEDRGGRAGGGRGGGRSRARGGQAGGDEPRPAGRGRPGRPAGAVPSGRVPAHVGQQPGHAPGRGEQSEDAVIPAHLQQLPPAPVRRDGGGVGVKTNEGRPGNQGRRAIPDGRPAVGSRPEQQAPAVDDQSAGDDRITAAQQRHVAPRVAADHPRWLVSGSRGNPLASIVRLLLAETERSRSRRGRSVRHRPAC